MYLYYSCSTHIKIIPECVILVHILLTHHLELSAPETNPLFHLLHLFILWAYIIMMPETVPKVRILLTHSQKLSMPEAVLTKFHILFLCFFSFHQACSSLSFSSKPYICFLILFTPSSYIFFLHFYSYMIVQHQMSVHTSLLRQFDVYIIRDSSLYDLCTHVYISMISLYTTSRRVSPYLGRAGRSCLRRRVVSSQCTSRSSR